MSNIIFSSPAKGVSVGTVVDLYEHSLQTASRALADGADEELVVVALLHDVGELLAPACHGEIGKGKSCTRWHPRHSSSVHTFLMQLPACYVPSSPRARTGS